MNPEFPHTASAASTMKKKLRVTVLLLCTALCAVACNQSKSDSKTDRNRTTTGYTGQASSHVIVAPEGNKDAFKTPESSKNLSRIIELTSPRMDGQDVFELQDRLLSLGFDEVGDADGYYGPLTAGAVKTIQTFSGLEPSGKVNRALWNFIFKDKNNLFLQNISSIITAYRQKESGHETKFPPNFTRIIESSLEGQDVLNLQNQLLALGFDEVGNADGYYGPLTERTICKIQTFSGFEPDGKVSQTLWDFIFNNEKTSFLQIVSIVSVYDPAELIRTRNLFSYGGPPKGDPPAGWSYYSPTDRKVKILIIISGPAAADHISACYFVNETFYFVEYTIRYHNGLKNERKMFLVNDYLIFEIVNGVLQGSDHNYESITDTLKFILDEKNTIKNYQTESDLETDGKGTVTKYTGLASSVVIPANINGVPVTAIGCGVFFDMELTSVTIPDGVTSVGEYAFYNNQLTSVALPDSVSSIGAAAFGSNKLTSVTIGGNVSLGKEVEEGWTNPSFSEEFFNFYNDNGMKAGTYLYSDGQWNMK